MVHQALLDFLRSAKKILVFTGAGISTPSGIPDYRGPQGVWKKSKPIYYQEFMSSEETRVRYWEEKIKTWEEYRKVKPNPIHYCLVDLDIAKKLQCVITQNVDGLHLIAGLQKSKLIELHGSARLVECQSCNERSNLEVAIEAFQKNRACPRCACGGLLKPAIIDFGQNLQKENLFQAGQHALLADLVIALGSTLSVEPAASIPLLAVAKGTPYIIINQGPTEHDHHKGLSLRIEGNILGIFPSAIQQSLEKHPAGSLPGKSVLEQEIS